MAFRVFSTIGLSYLAYDLIRISRTVKCIDGDKTYEKELISMGMSLGARFMHDLFTLIGGKDSVYIEVIERNYPKQIDGFWHKGEKICRLHTSIDFVGITEGWFVFGEPHPKE